MKIRRRKVSKHIKMIAVLAAVFLVGTTFYLVTITGLSVWELLQNLATPSMSTVRIIEGMREEEVVNRFAKTLNWTEKEKEQLVKSYTLAMKGKSEGYYVPKTYLVSPEADPKDISLTLQKTFNTEVLDKQAKLKSNVINTDTVLKIASIIQREAGGKHDMNIVSGIIWNRMFKGMSLDIDATLQYAKGTEQKWWPKVVPADKKIVSPYNTYKHKGLPPSPISNPGAAAIDAALNPKKTKALFYMHDSYGNIHTAETYSQHVANIETYY